MEEEKNQDCHNHPLKKGLIRCSLCEHLFCLFCLSEKEGLVLCLDHKSLMSHKKWHCTLNLQCSEENNSLGLLLYQFKKKLWESQNILSYLSFEYSHSASKNIITTTMKLHSLENDMALIKNLWGKKIKGIETNDLYS
jgi:hypothetical protein